MHSVQGAAAVATAAAGGLPDMPGLFVVPGECASSFSVQVPVPAPEPFGHSRCRPAWLCCICIGVCLFIRSSMLQQQAAAHAGWALVREWVYLFVWCLNVQHL